MKRFVLFLSFFLFATASHAEFPVVDRGDFIPNDKRLCKPINESKQDELTIASFNIRNLGARQRSLRNFEGITDLIDESDVVMIQEAGLGVYNGLAVSTNQMKRMKAVTAVLQINLGDNWMVIVPPSPSGTGRGTETTIIAYKKICKGYEISAEWDSYVDLGDKRDMAVFKLILSKNIDSKDIHVASVHLTPKDPDRGQQMIKVAEWLVSQKQNRVVVMGDFNWGYKKTTGVDNYEGEQRVRELHESEDIFQLFYELSYLGKSNGTKLRTNMGFRSGGYFYDQFLMTPVLANEMADGGKLLQDCGILAFDIQSKQMKDTINYWKAKREYGLVKYLKNANITVDTNQQAYDKTKKNIVDQAANDATFIISDHRIIWIQLKVW